MSNIAGAKTSSSLAMVARRPADHNLKAAGSNPAPATKYFPNRQNNKAPDRRNGRGFAVFAKWHGDARFDVGNRCGKLSLVPQLS
ncbi:hypothetical protein GFM02_34655 [Rhizobium leguminosarum bv. viciae]|uniref:hypothetical protein n=1 Tax=Rhizobium leguminosarum TaxID=384 RepID=UPI00144153E8|nr:hypothetical protein [Rhizobium leguminosarum]NKL03228.1 hypothetical protein [Rhizobium leguminosarum bv. viciae]